MWLIILLVIACGIAVELAPDKEEKDDGDGPSSSEPR